jgi:hypothetical protein
MSTRIARTLYAAALILACWMIATPAFAQFQPRPLEDLPVGENYHIEGAAGFWFPTSDIFVASESLGIPGTLIDFRKDLGLQDQSFGELHFEVRPVRSQKFRFQYIPITYTATGRLTRDLIFNGQRYRAGLPVNSTLDWKAYRFGYEFDFITTDRAFGGFIADFKYTDVNVKLTSAAVNEFARARAPVPALGGIARVYVTRNISITGEVTGFKLPQNLIEDSTGHYVDVDVRGTYNFTNSVGAQFGFRAFDVSYAVKTDTGSFTLKGLFFGIVARY